MAERCPPSRCEIHLERSITDGIRWAKDIMATGTCAEKARSAADHYEQAREAMGECQMRAAFEHLRTADMHREKVEQCLRVQGVGTNGFAGGWEIRKIRRRRRR